MSIPANLPAGWVVLGAKDALPVTSPVSRLPAVSHAMAFQSVGDVVYGFTVDTATGNITRRDTADWTAADYDTYGSAWMASSVSQVAPSVSSPGIAHNCYTSGGDMAPVGGLIFTDVDVTNNPHMIVMSSVTDNENFGTTSYVTTDPDDLPAGLAVTVAVLRVSTPIPITRAYRSHDATGNSFHNIYVNSMLTRKEKDGTIAFWRVSSSAYYSGYTASLSDLFFANSVGLDNNAWYSVTVGDGELFLTEVPADTPGAWHGALRFLDPVGAYTAGDEDFQRIANALYVKQPAVRGSVGDPWVWGALVGVAVLLVSIMAFVHVAASGQPLMSGSSIADNKALLVALAVAGGVVALLGAKNTF